MKFSKEYFFYKEYENKLKIIKIFNKGKFSRIESDIMKEMERLWLEMGPEERGLLKKNKVIETEEKTFLLKIEKSVVIQREHGSDHVILHTNLPTAMPDITNEPLSLDFVVAKGDGVNYVKNVFGLEPEIIKA